MGAGLRERKKQETRQAISHVATRLFIERGFDQVTITQVAEAAGVAKMTVTNYFPRKEDLVLDLHDEIVHGLARVVADRGPGESVTAAVRRSYVEGLEHHAATLGFAGADFARLINESPTLLARLRELWEQREAALAAVLGGDLAARIEAAQVATADRVLFQEGMRRSAAGQPAGEIAAALAEAARWTFDALGDWSVVPGRPQQPGEGTAGRQVPER